MLVMFGLRGSIPTEIGLLTSLTFLDFGSSEPGVNELMGQIPTEIGLLTNLEVLSLGT